MNIDDLKNTWKQQNQKLEECIKINTQTINREKLSQNQRHITRGLIKRIIEAVLFFVIVVALWQYIVSDFAIDGPTVSAFILNIFAILGLASNIGQITLLNRIDLSKPIKTVQHQIFEVRQHKLALTKLVILSVPLYMAYVFLFADLMFGIDLYQTISDTTKFFYWISTVLLFFPILYFVRQLSRKNIQKPWVAKMIHHIEGADLLAIAEVLNELDEESPKKLDVQGYSDL